MNLKRWTIGAVVLLLSISHVLGQDQPEWSLTSAQPLQALVGEDYEPYLPTLSPDGSVVGWWDEKKDQICAYRFADAETTCYTSDENMLPFGPYSYPSWSPDGRYLVFTESFFDRLVDSDIWILDTQNDQITDLTDDHVFSGMLDLDKGEQVLVDYLPTWDLITGDLFFFRSSRVEGIWTTGLYRLTEAGFDPELVIDLSTNVPTLSIFRRGAISPDGQQMAVGVAGQDPGDPLNGIYLIGLSNGDLTKVAELSDLQEGWPEWAKNETRLFPTMIAWSDEDTLVITSVDDSMPTSPGANTVLIDVASGDVTPLIDFSQIDERSEFFKTPDGPIDDVLRIGVVAPDGKSFWGLRYAMDFQAANMVVLPLPPDSEDREGSEVPDFRIMPRTMYETSVSSDGKALMFGWLFTFEQK